MSSLEDLLLSFDCTISTRPWLATSLFRLTGSVDKDTLATIICGSISKDTLVTIICGSLDKDTLVTID